MGPNRLPSLVTLYLANKWTIGRGARNNSHCKAAHVIPIERVEPARELHCASWLILVATPGNNGDQRSQNLSPITVDHRRPLHVVDMTPRVAIRGKKTSIGFALTFTTSSASGIRVWTLVHKDAEVQQCHRRGRRLLHQPDEQNRGWEGELLVRSLDRSWSVGIRSSCRFSQIRSVR
jgi:hypothetical protein